MNTPLCVTLGLALTLNTALCCAAGLAPLKQRYLACAQEASERRLANHEAAACSQVAEHLLQQGFHGDLAQLLQWWQSARLPVSLEQAQALYEAGRYTEAFVGFAGLADCGHREAARIALQMRQFGPRLYGSTLTAGPKQLWRWRTLLARQASTADSGCTTADPPADSKPAATPPTTAPTTAPLGADRAIAQPLHIG